MSWAARTERRKDAGSVDIGRTIDATEDTATRRFAAAATPPTAEPTPQDVQARVDRVSSI
jgi:hypothetical protein